MRPGIWITKQSYGCRGANEMQSRASQQVCYCNTVYRADDVRNAERPDLHASTDSLKRSTATPSGGSGVPPAYEVFAGRPPMPGLGSTGRAFARATAWARALVSSGWNWFLLLPSRFSGRSRPAIRMSSSSQGWSRTSQLTRVFCIHADRTGSPTANVRR